MRTRKIRQRAIQTRNKMSPSPPGSVLTLAILFLLISATPAPAQETAEVKQSVRGSNSSCNRESAVDLIRTQMDGAKLIDKPVKRIAVLLGAADLLWPYDQKSSRMAFGEAFDLAVVNFKEQGD